MTTWKSHEKSEEGLAWNEIVSYDFDADTSGWFHLHLNVVFTDGSKGPQFFKFSLKEKWSHAAISDQNKESAHKFFASEKAASIVAEVKAWCKSRRRDTVKAYLRRSVADALSEGFDHGELKELVDEVLAESVMGA